MKKLYQSLLMLVVFTAFTVKAQQNLSADVFTGMMFHQTSYPDTDYNGYKPNLTLGAGLGYNIEPSVRLRGQLQYGHLNGNNDQAYFEAQLWESTLGVDVNLLQILTGIETFKINIHGGTGMAFYHSRLYNRATGRKISESPVRRNSSVSPNALMTYGASVEVPITKKLSINAQYLQRYLINTPYLDVTDQGNTDQYSALTAGLTFYLKSDRKPGTTEVDTSRFQDLLNQAEASRQMAETLDDQDEKIRQQRITIELQEEKLNALEFAYDSLVQAGMTIDSISRSESFDNRDALQVLNGRELKQEAYRVIIASLASPEKAYNWMKSKNLNPAELQVVYSEEVDSYRVIHSSHPSFPAARKTLLEIRSRFSDAWIIKF